MFFSLRVRVSFWAVNYCYGLSPPQVLDCGAERPQRLLGNDNKSQRKKKKKKLIVTMNIYIYIYIYIYVCIDR